MTSMYMHITPTVPDHYSTLLLFLDYNISHEMWFQFQGLHTIAQSDRSQVCLSTVQHEMCVIK